MRELAQEMQMAVNAETGEITFNRAGQQSYEQAVADRRSIQTVAVSGTLEGDRPVELHAHLHIGKKEIAEEITPAVNHEMYKIDSSENNRGRGN